MKFIMRCEFWCELIQRESYIELTLFSIHFHNSAWEGSHRRGDLIVRFYKEDWGMTSEEFSKIRGITHAYAAKKRASFKRLGQKQHRKQVAEEYAQALRDAFQKSPITQSNFVTL